MRYGVCWWKRGMPTLGTLLDAEIVYPPLLGRDVDALLAWGRKRGTARALRWPWAPQRPVIYAEDGFLRSLDLGFRTPPLSVVLDATGIYYDATQPSGFEALMQAGRDAAARARGAALAAAWRAQRVSKYNHAAEAPPPVHEPYVLVVDQTRGDASITCGLAGASSFARMLDAALAEHPGMPVVLKVHPDVVAGHKQGHFDLAALARMAPRVHVVASDAHAPALIEPAHAVYVVTSQMGFEALVWGKPVRSFGMPFYAGWGLTADDLAPPARRTSAGTQTLADLVHAALVQYPRCLDPATGRRGEAEQLVAWVGAQRRARGLGPAC